MPSNDKAGLKQAFAHLRRPEEDEAAELKLLGRTVGATQQDPAPPGESYHVATSKIEDSRRQVGAEAPTGLTPRPLLQREPERQISFRCPVSLAAELQRKARFNQLEQQEILKEGLKRVLSGLSDPPEGWVG